MSVKIKIQGINQVNRLLNSKKAQLGRGKQSVLVGYGNEDVDYAIYVHEDLEPKSWTTEGTGPKFLEEAPYSVDELADVVSNSLKNGQSLLDGLEEAGKLVLDRSQPLVPFDSGALRESGFVRREASEG